MAVIIDSLVTGALIQILQTIKPHSMTYTKIEYAALIAISSAEFDALISDALLNAIAS